MTPAPELNPHLEDAVYRRLAEAAGLIYVDLRTYHIPGGFLKRIPLAQAKEMRWVPMIFNSRRVVLIVDDPFKALVQDRGELARRFGPPWDREFNFALASPAAMDDFFEKKYPD